MSDTNFRIYLVFLVSFFMHLTARFTALGTIRFDFLLVVIIFALSFAERSGDNKIADVGGTGKYLKMLILYMLFTLPLVEWPGTVLRAGAPGFIKAVIFYYFTVMLASNEKKLKVIVYVLLACQVARVMEPLYLNIVDGYWGDVTHLGDGEFANRLSGAPTDIINPNELGYVIIVDIILLYYLFIAKGSFVVRSIALAAVAACLYALILTASRSAFLVMGGVILMIAWGAKQRYLILTVLVVTGLLTVSSMSDFHKDRYLSIFESDKKGSETAQGRLDSLLVDLEVSMNRPLVGHGLGTSKEANYNIGDKGQISHNLYLEVATELGYIGLIIYLYFLKSIVKNIKYTKEQVVKYKDENDDFVKSLTSALYVWAVATFVFSFAQYGLSIYSIYFIAGLAVVLQRVIIKEDRENSTNVTMVK